MQILSVLVHVDTIAQDTVGTDPHTFYFLLLQLEKQDNFYNVQLPWFLERFDRMLQDNGYFVGNSVRSTFID